MPISGEREPGAQPEVDSAASALELRRRVADAAKRRRAANGEGPLVAVAVATYMPLAKPFELLVESIRAQDHENWICVVSDDHSPDDRVGAIRRVIGDDARFVISSSPEHQGTSGNFERALAAIGKSANLVALADQADVWHPQKLRHLIRSLGSDAQLAYSDLRILGLDRVPLVDSVGGPARGQPLTIAALLETSPMPGSAALFRSDLLDVALPFPRELGLRHDQWLALAALTTGTIRFEDEALTEHRATNPDRALELATEAATGSRERPRASRQRHSQVEVEDTEERVLEILTERRDQSAGSHQPSHTKAVDSPNGWARATTATSPSGGSVPVGHDLAISVQGISKTFAVPAAQPETLGARVRHPLSRVQRDRFTALEDVSFDVARGEFFGIVGGNGSGKTTLLQILANVYKADAGRVFIAPRVAPIISLGIGFQPDLPALPNVLMTAELLGVSAPQAHSRFDELLAFAGLEEFADLKLRNYSSGMRVRLAFATVMLVDADVLLLDEVLAVGDGAFKEKATKAFEELRSEKTVVLVTHSMQYLLNYCDRALLLDRGRVDLLGDATEVARRYAELSLEQHGQSTDVPPRATVPAVAKPQAEITDMWLADANGKRTTSVPFGEDIVVHATVTASASIREPGLLLELRRRGAARIFAPPTLAISHNGKGVRPGGRLQVETAIENKLAPGPYTVACTVTATNQEGKERSVSPARTMDFAVAPGPGETLGMVNLDHKVRVTRRGRPGAKRRASKTEGH